MNLIVKCCMFLDLILIACTFDRDKSKLFLEENINNHTNQLMNNIIFNITKTAQILGKFATKFTIVSKQFFQNIIISVHCVK